MSNVTKPNPQDDVRQSRAAMAKDQRQRSAACHATVIGIATHHDTTDRAVQTANGRRGQRIQSRVEKMWLSREITHAEYISCERYHDDWAMGLYGISPGDGGGGIRVDRSRTLPGANDMQLDALSRHGAVRAALGHAAEWYLIHVVCLDWPWQQVGRGALVSDKTAKDRSIKIINALDEHYHDADRAHDVHGYR